MTYDIKYTELIDRKTMRKIPYETLVIIKTAIENRLGSNPYAFGKPLQRSLKGFRGLRVGDYRIIFRIQKMTVYIIAIDHRSVVYKRLERQLGK